MFLTKIKPQKTKFPTVQKRVQLNQSPSLTQTSLCIFLKRLCIYKHKCISIHTFTTYVL